MVKTKDNVVKLDDTDVNILKIINEDVRTSYRQNGEIWSYQKVLTSNRP